MLKKLKVLLIVIASILIAIMLALGIYFLFPWNGEFFSNATKEFAIPGLDSNFTPQGFSEINDNTFLISGYMSDGSASRLYVVNSDSGDNHYVTLLDNGADFTGHVGGVQCYGNTGWVVSVTDEGGYCYRFNINDILNANSGSKIDIIDKFATNNGADFVFEHEGLLWVGEFYRDGNYVTDATHHIQTRSGETNPAVVFAYDIDESKAYGIDSVIPVRALSIRGLCQGIDITNEGKFVMSTSYSIPDSNIYYYENVLSEANHSNITINGSVVPLWLLDEESLISTTNAPSMSEEVVVKGDKVYILFESACKKYRLVNRKKLTDVYSLPISSLEK
ncbi:MAG: hypothetical protein E7361_01515 [Clostridiales bacterium]|nr:hypothetical protein [Clostridiales bacterium]